MRDGCCRGRWAGCRAGVDLRLSRCNDRHVTLAIDLRPGRANLAVVDINGKILGREAVPYEIKAGSTADEARTAIAHIAQAAHTLQANFEDRVFQGLGVSVFRCCRQND